MRRWRFLLKPGWLVLTLVVVAFAGFCFSTLAPWQLGKNGSTEERNNRIAAATGAAPVAWGELTTPGTTPAVDSEWRSVDVTGTYLPQDEVLARLRVIDGHPAYEVLTPFLVGSGPGAGATVLVDRGYVRPVQGTDAPPVPPAPTGTVTLDALQRLDEPWAPERGVVPDPGTAAPQVYAVSADLVGPLVGTTLSPGYLQLSADQPGVLGVLPLPQLDAGPYLSYGLQWIAFGIMAPLGLAYFVRAEIRERKAARTDGEGSGGDPADGAATEQDATAPAPARPAPAAVSRPRRRGRRAMVADAVRDGALRDPAGAAPPADRVSAPAGTVLADRYGKRR
ncbi:SURF1 family cytochrome oxidase biogenesis protein [Rhodococcus aerolatus]